MNNQRKNFMKINHKRGNNQSPIPTYKKQAQKQLQAFLEDCNETGVCVPPAVLSKISKGFQDLAFHLLHSGEYNLKSDEDLNRKPYTGVENLSKEDEQRRLDSLDRL